MMLYSAPALDPAESAVLSSIYALCRKIDWEYSETQTWNGLLSRQVFDNRGGRLMALAANNDISNPVLADSGRDDWRALEGYRTALSIAMRPAFSWTLESILALHSVMLEHDRDALRGHWRGGRVKILNVYGEVVYEAPDADQVPHLMLEFLGYLSDSHNLPPIIHAAMVFLNMLRIHPFQDGNGRMGRCLQASILWRSRDLAAEIANLEEYVGQYTGECNNALESTGYSWQPDRSTREWIRFCLTAHYRQAIGLVRKMIYLRRLSDELNARRGARLPDRLIGDLGEIFGARPEVIGRWWSMRPDGVIAKLTVEAGGHKLRGWPFWWERSDFLEGHSALIAALLIPASMDRGAPLPDPFSLVKGMGV